MKWSFGAWILAVGCAGGGAPGGGPNGGGGGDSGDGDSGEPPVVEEPVVVRVCSDAAIRTVQEGLDAAPPGAVVELCGERFEGPIHVRRGPVTLVGEPGAVLDGGGEARPITVEGHPFAPTVARISGVTVTGGRADRGGGIACDDAVLVLTDVRVERSLADRGGGIAARACDVTLERVTLEANEAWGEGGGGFFEGGSLLVDASVVAQNVGANGGGLLVRGAVGEARDSTFEDNRGHVGGGLWFDGGFGLLRSLVRRNEARYTGGGFASVGGYGRIAQNLVEENSSQTDGGGGFTEAYTGEVTENTFQANTSLDDAGGLRMLYGAATITSNVFTDNAASGGSGGAMKVSHAGCDIRDNTFVSNVASEDGGGVEVDDDVSVLADNVFRDNRAGNRGGALHYNEPYWNTELGATELVGNSAGGCGGALAMDDDGLPESPEDRYTVAATHLEARENSAPTGSVACVLVGGMTFTNALFVHNTAEDGGALVASGAELALTNVTLASNVGGPAVEVLAGARASVTDTIVSDHEGVVTSEGSVPVWRYTLHHGIVGEAFRGMADPTGENGNIEGDPRFLGEADFHLSPGSPAIDAGDPARTDADGSAVDLGAYGGAGGEW